MKLTLKSVKELKQECTNALAKYTWNYVISRWRDYDDKKHIFTDVLHHGCVSGIVGELVYYVDTVAFYEKYKDEINSLLYETMSETGLYSLSDIFGDKWDKEDPLGIDVHNQNLLVWFGFEETLRNIGYNFEALEQQI